jgi:hypothetical protein
MSDEAIKYCNRTAKVTGTATIELVRLTLLVRPDRLVRRALNPSLFSHEYAWCQRSTTVWILRFPSRVLEKRKRAAPCQITMDLSRDRPESGQSSSRSAEESGTSSREVPSAPGAPLQGPLIGPIGRWPGKGTDRSTASEGRYCSSVLVPSLASQLHHRRGAP